MSMPTTPAAAGAAPRKVKPKSSTRTYTLVAVLCALALFAIVLVGSGGDEGKWVLVARQTIPARAELDTDLFEARQMAEDAIVAGAIVGDSSSDVIDAAEEVGIDGAVAQYPLPKGGQFTETLISIETELAEPLGPDERLVSVSAAYDASVAGAIKAGDRVDVYAVGTSGLEVANLVLGDVEVAGISLPADQVSSVYQRQLNAAESGEELSAAEALPAEPIPGVFTLRVPVASVAALAAVSEHAVIYLSFRGADAGVTPGEPVDLVNILCSLTVSEGTDPAVVAEAQASLPAACGGTGGG